jgi:hypothetical protein
MPHQQCPLCLKATTIIPQTHWFLQNTIQAGTARWVVHPSRESVCTFEVKVFKSLLMSELKRHIEGVIPNQGKNLQILAHVRTQKREKGNIPNQGKNLQILAHVRT